MPEGPGTAPDTGLTYLTTKPIRKTAPLMAAPVVLHTGHHTVLAVTVAHMVAPEVMVARTVGVKP